MWRQAIGRAVRRALGGAVLLLAIACPAGAEESATDAKLQQATAHFARGEYEQAEAMVRPFLEERRPPLQALFIAAHLSGVRGACAEAAGFFRAMLTRDPALLRPRLDLGLLLSRCGEPREGLYHLERALAGDLPRQVQQGVVQIVNTIREQIGGLSFRFQLIRETNANQQTKASETTIGGTRFQLDSQARGKAANGASLAIDARYPLLSEWSLYAGGYGEHREFPGESLDFSYLQPTVGSRARRGSHTISAEIGYHGAYLDSGLLYRGGTWRLSDLWTFAPSSALALSADAKQLRYRELAFRDGVQYQLSGTIHHIPDPTTAFQTGLSYVRASAAEPAYAFEGPGLFAAVQREIANGWIAGARTDAASTRFAAADPLFGIARKDHRLGVEASLANRGFGQAFGSLPALIVGVSKAESNIDLFRYVNAYAKVAFTRNF